MRKFGAGQIGFDFVSVDNALLHFVQHFDGFLHIGGVAVCHGNGIVNHHQGSRCHQNLRACHCNYGSGTGGNAVYFDCYIPAVIHEHGINLTCGNTVTARRIQPYGNGTGACKQFIPEHLRRDIVVKPGFFCNGAVQFKGPFRFGVGLVLPRPELFVFHRLFLPPLLEI